MGLPNIMAVLCVFWCRFAVVVIGGFTSRTKSASEQRRSDFMPEFPSTYVAFIMPLVLHSAPRLLAAKPLQNINDPPPNFTVGMLAYSYMFELGISIIISVVYFMQLFSSWVPIIIELTMSMHVLQWNTELYTLCVMAFVIVQADMGAWAGWAAERCRPTVQWGRGS